MKGASSEDFETIAQHDEKSEVFKLYITGTMENLKH